MQKVEYEVEKVKKLSSVLKSEEISQIQSGRMVALCHGKKLSLDDDVKGTIILISALQGG